MPKQTGLPRRRNWPAAADERKARAVTVKDVAIAAGVSAGTVSRVTSNNPAVQPDLRAHVLSVIKRLGYRPNPIAQSMRTAETKLIGCVVSDFSNPLYSAILKSAETTLLDEGYTLVIASSDNRIDREVQIIETLARRRVDGLMAVLSDERAPQLIQALGEAAIPLLMMERDMDVPGDLIATDHLGGTQRATEYLLSLGHRRIALITGSTSTRSGRDRAAGYRAAHAARDVAVDEALVRCESLTTAFAFKETQRLLTAPEPPTAVIAGGNMMLAGVLRALGVLECRVPADVSVVSSGDTELAELAAPPVTVIRWDLVEFGREAAKLMLHRLRNRDAAPRRIVVPCSLVVRGSCAPLRDDKSIY